MNVKIPDIPRKPSFTEYLQSKSLPFYARPGFREGKAFKQFKKRETQKLNEILGMLTDDSTSRLYSEIANSICFICFEMIAEDVMEEDVETLGLRSFKQASQNKMSFLFTRPLLDLPIYASSMCFASRSYRRVFIGRALKYLYPHTDARILHRLYPVIRERFQVDSVVISAKYPKLTEIVDVVVEDALLRRIHTHACLVQDDEFTEDTFIRDCAIKEEVDAISFLSMVASQVANEVFAMIALSIEEKREYYEKDQRIGSLTAENVHLKKEVERLEMSLENALGQKEEKTIEQVFIKDEMAENALLDARRDLKRLQKKYDSLLGRYERLQEAVDILPSEDDNDEISMVFNDRSRIAFVVDELDHKETINNALAQFPGSVLVTDPDKLPKDVDMAVILTKYIKKHSTAWKTRDRCKRGNIPLLYVEKQNAERIAASVRGYGNWKEG